jgi:phosphatidate cytidylyltransferase
LAALSRGPDPDVPAAEPVPLAENQKPVALRSRGELVLRVASALVLAPLAIGTAYVGGWVFGLFWGIAALGIWWEWNALVSGAHNRLLFVLGAATLALAFGLTENGMVRTPMLIVGLGALGAGVFAQAERRTWATGGLVYAGALLIAPIVLRRDADYGFIALIFLFAIVWTTDVVGYFVGKAIGGPKLAPKISPHKTWSGAIGGVVGAAIVGIVLTRLTKLENTLAVTVIAVLLSIVAQAGDLFESAVKRRFGAKDASQLIPGHGGLMDRLDGFVAAAVVGALIGMLREGMDAAAQGLLIW